MKTKKAKTKEAKASLAAFYAWRKKTFPSGMNAWPLRMAWLACGEYEARRLKREREEGCTKKN